MAVINPEKVAQIVDSVPSSLAIDGNPPETVPLTTLMRGTASAVTFAVIENGSIDCVGAVGKPDPSPHPVPFAAPQLNTEHIFEAASLSKPVTAYATLQLLAREGIDLDAPIDDFLSTDIPPDPSSEFIVDKVPEASLAKFRGKGITFRQLLSHSSGIKDPNKHEHLASGGEWTPEQLLELATLDPYVPDAPKIFHYSNAGFTLLEYLLENITRRPFPQIMQEQVLTPLEMANSTFSQSDATLSALEAQHKLVIGQNVEQGIITKPIKYSRATEGLRTTAEDYAKFMQALMAAYNDVDAENPIKAMFAEQDILDEHGQKSNYGLGIVISHSAEKISFSHNGVDNGFVSSMIIHPKTGQGAVIFNNYSPNASLYSSLMNSIAIVNAWETIPAAIPVYSVPETDFDQYIGKYSILDGEVEFEILVVDRKLSLAIPFPQKDSPPVITQLFISEDGKTLLIDPAKLNNQIVNIHIATTPDGARNFTIAFEGGMFPIQPLEEDTSEPQRTTSLTS